MVRKIGLLELHRNFRKEFMQSAMLNCSKISAIPTFVFLVFSFILIYGLLHRRTRYGTSIRVRLYRDLGFHWTYFYITKVWFLLVRAIKYATEFVEAYLESVNEVYIPHEISQASIISRLKYKPSFASSSSTFVVFMLLECIYKVTLVPLFKQLNDTQPKRFYLNTNVIRGIAFSILLSAAAVPAVLLFIKVFYKQTVPNFLMWVPEDPWMGSEIGVAGHYLLRPPRFTGPSKKKKDSYRVRKSSSLEHLNEKVNVGLRIRNCRSLEHCTISTH